jgi:hypothetical protein
LIVVGRRIGSVSRRSWVCFVLELSNDLPIVSGIGHKIKSVNNPDLRVEIVKEYVVKHFPSHTLLDYALAVEKVTTSKKDTVSSSLPLPHAPLTFTAFIVVDSKRRWLYRRLFRRLTSR